MLEILLSIHMLEMKAPIDCNLLYVAVIPMQGCSLLVNLNKIEEAGLLSLDQPSISVN